MMSRCLSSEFDCFWVVWFQIQGQLASWEAKNGLWNECIIVSVFSKSYEGGVRPKQVLTDSNTTRYTFYYNLHNFGQTNTLNTCWITKSVAGLQVACKINLCVDYHDRKKATEVKVLYSHTYMAKTEWLVMGWEYITKTNS